MALTQPADPPADAWRGAREILPIAVGVAIYALAFGVLAAQAQFSALQVGVMGASVFAGGAQIIASQQLVAGAGAVAALVAGLALNLRLLLVTASYCWSERTAASQLWLGGTLDSTGAAVRWAWVWWKACGSEGARTDAMPPAIISPASCSLSLTDPSSTTTAGLPTAWPPPWAPSLSLSRRRTCRWPHAPASACTRSR